MSRLSLPTSKINAGMNTRTLLPAENTIINLLSVGSISRAFATVLEHVGMGTVKDGQYETIVPTGTTVQSVDLQHGTIGINDDLSTDCCYWEYRLRLPFNDPRLSNFRLEP